MRYYLLYIILFFAASSLYPKQLSIDLDGAVFRHDESRSGWELYYTFPDTIAKYQLKNNKYSCKLLFSILIISNIDTIEKKKWYVDYSCDTIPSQHRMSLCGQQSFLLPFGQYTVKLNVIDQYDTTSSASVNFPIFVRKFPELKFQISDIELAQGVESISDTLSNIDDLFRKNTLRVLPNPSLIYVGNKQNLQAYLEIYNGKKISPQGIKIIYKIFDAAKHELISIPKTRIPETDGIVEIAELSVNVLPSGVYYLQAVVLSENQEITDSTSVMKKFYVVNPEIPPELEARFIENLSFEKSEWSVLSSDRVETEFKMTKPIATAYELEQFEKLSTTEAKQRFLYSFWLKRDTDTTTTLNERLFEYRKLIGYANNFFNAAKSGEGWRTDRGRVLLQYGMPTQRDQNVANGDNRAYEIWSYSSVQGGAMFCFVDMVGYGNYILVHSTAIGEQRNENWYKEYVPANNAEGDSDIYNINQR